MKQHPATTAKLTESELDEIRTLIEQRSAILFDASRERFFSTRVREYLEEKESRRAAPNCCALVRGSSIEYEALLERLLTQETSFFRYPAVYEALEKKILPEMQERKFWESPRTLRIWSAGCSTGEEPYSIAITRLRRAEICGGLGNRNSGDGHQPPRAAPCGTRRVFASAACRKCRSRQVEAYFSRDEARLSGEAAHPPHDFVRADEPGRNRCTSASSTASSA